MGIGDFGFNKFLWAFQLLLDVFWAVKSYMDRVAGSFCFNMAVFLFKNLSRIV